MKKVTQLVSDILSVGAALVVLAAGYMYMNGIGFPTLSSLGSFSPPSVGLPSLESLVPVIVVLSLASSAYISYRYRGTLLRGPVKVKMIR